MFATYAFSLLALLAISPASAHEQGRRYEHDAIAHRARGDVQTHSKRAFNGMRATYYAVGLGACGKYNVASDYIVALNSAQYGSGYPGPECFKSITISYGGKTAQATIMDECPTCPYGGLDLSQGLFEHFASTDLGVLSINWSYNDGSGSSEPATTKEEPKPTTSTKKWVAPTTSKAPEPEPEPTTTWKPKTTSTYEEPKTTYSPPEEKTTSTQKSTSKWVEPTTSYAPPTTTSTHSIPKSTSTSTSTSTLTSTHHTTSTHAVTTSSKSTSSKPPPTTTSAAPSTTSAVAESSTSSSAAPTTSSAAGNFEALNDLLLTFGDLLIAGANQ